MTFVCSISARVRTIVLLCAHAVLILLCTLVCGAQTESEHPIPILTGNAGYFTNVESGRTALVPEVYPVLLIPAGDRWLVEARGEFKGEFERKPNNGPYGGQVENELDYLQVDYIANPYLTVTAGASLPHSESITSASIRFGFAICSPSR